jgi:outer membrane protein OmpA-like peptidoglycan-associated protein
MMKVVTRLMVLILVVVLAAGCSTASKRAKCIAAGAAAGAAVGAGIGAVVGHQGDEDTAEGAAVGVAAGALVGGIIGAIVCKEEAPPPPPPPPAPEPVAEEPPPPKVVEKIVLNGIQFDFDKAVIKDQYYPILDEGSAALEKHTDKKVVVEGYTCNIGAEDYNLRLSEKRAEAVKTYMVEKGISADRLSTVGYGEANPVADNATRQGREMNRRVEFKVMNGE